ncbi:hypothetical protein [Bradyrhizobium neotropicale]|uniref:Protein TolA n=1 Tax=Bradyrhizobium neotropicale TaxID=1497615 RepID=A0A176YN63_9BRAD|nr:hypothetical protein [Bradyrhizobium neotropicale]OAF07470.1 hypothetical protein AXW67_30080 [Bradyrhizobium neotropicale]
MELRRIIRTDIAASAIAHLTLVGLIILISEVHPFRAAPPETVSVDIVTPEQVQEQVKEQEAKEEAKEKTPEAPLPDLKLPKLDFNDKAEATAPSAKQSAPAPSPSPAPPASPEPQRQQAQPQPSSAAKQREANVQPQEQATPQPQATQQPQTARSAQPQPTQQPPPVPPPPQAEKPAYAAPEPDVTVKYGVMLGLPPDLSLAPKDAPKDDGGDAKDSIAAKLPAEVVAEFRRHLRSCAKLPAGVAPGDNVHIKLRAVMATDGTLARAPVLIEASASAKGPLLMQSAMSALLACQPYKMLPVDKYQEWKVMDLPFTPRDFGGS